MSLLALHGSVFTLEANNGFWTGLGEGMHLECSNSLAHGWNNSKPDSLVKCISLNPNGLFTCYSMYPQS